MEIHSQVSAYHTHLFYIYIIIKLDLRNLESDRWPSASRSVSDTECDRWGDWLCSLLLQLTEGTFMCIPLISLCMTENGVSFPQPHHKNTPENFYGLVNKTAEQSMKTSFLLSSLPVWLSGCSSLFIVYVHIHFFQAVVMLCLETRLVGGRVGRLPVCHCDCLRAGRQRRWLSSAVGLEPGITPVGLLCPAQQMCVRHKVWVLIWFLSQQMRNFSCLLP